MLNKANSIKQKCLECVGSPKEVSLCHVVDCPLWLHRFGYSAGNKKFRKRIEVARDRYPEEFAEVRSLVLDYIENMPNSAEYAHIRDLFE